MTAKHSDSCSAIFFVGLTGLEAPLVSSPGLQVTNRLRLTNDRATIARMVNQYLESIGKVELAFLTGSASAVLYSRETIPIDKREPIESMNAHLVGFLHEVQGWLMHLWHLGDNAVNADTGWLVTTYGGENIANSNIWSSTYSNSIGAYQPEHYSLDHLDMREAFPVEAEFFDVSRPIPLARPGSGDERATKLQSSENRGTRFLYFVNGARNARDIAVKLTLYCSAVESLISSSHTEIVHQIAERSAFILGNNGKERLQIFRDVKAAYGMRSKAVHGAAFKKKDEQRLIEASQKMDGFCRSLAMQIYSNEELRHALDSDQAAVDFYFQRAIFGITD